MRFGFEDDRNFEEILTILDKHQIDLLVYMQERLKVDIG